MLNTVIVCVNQRSNPRQPSCGARGSLEIAQALEQGIVAQGITGQVERFYCLGECQRGPNLRLLPGGQFYHKVRLEDVPMLLDMLKKAADLSR
jgi:(2Fe-2S) ferredoxin